MVDSRAAAGKMPGMRSRAHRWLAVGPRAMALLVLIASLLVAPLAIAAPPEPCCCPQPARCKCPDHQAANRGHASVRRCGAPVRHPAPLPAPIAALPAPLVLATVVAAAPAPVTTLPSPHASPDLERPRGPS